MMRKIDFEEPDTPDWENWRRTCQNATDRFPSVKDVVEHGKKIPDIQSTIYAPTEIKKKYFVTPGAPFYGKCAYCEAKIRGTHPGDIDHFRPKLRVTDAKDNVVYLKDKDGNLKQNADGKPILHPGYFWLAYDWQNLLPSCEECNRPTTEDAPGGTAKKIKRGKRNRFPVRSRHAQTPEEVANEVPLLIHPVFDNPRDYLDVDPKTGVIFSKNQSDRGQSCLDVLKLNEREDLVKARKRICRLVKGLCSRRITAETTEEIDEINSEIQEHKDGKHPHTLAALATLDYVAAISANF